MKQTDRALLAIPAFTWKVFKMSSVSPAPLLMDCCQLYPRPSPLTPTPQHFVFDSGFVFVFCFLPCPPNVTLSFVTWTPFKRAIRDIWYSDNTAVVQTQRIVHIHIHRERERKRVLYEMYICRSVLELCRKANRWTEGSAVLPTPVPHSQNVALDVRPPLPLPLWPRLWATPEEWFQGPPPCTSAPQPPSDPCSHSTTPGSGSPVSMDGVEGLFVCGWRVGAMYRGEDVISRWGMS